jgi:hypothetical protein
MTYSNVQITNPLRKPPNQRQIGASLEACPLKSIETLNPYGIFSTKKKNHHPTVSEK